MHCLSEIINILYYLDEHLPAIRHQNTLLFHKILRPLKSGIKSKLFDSSKSKVCYHEITFWFCS